VKRFNELIEKARALSDDVEYIRKNMRASNINLLAYVDMLLADAASVAEAINSRIRLDGVYGYSDSIFCDSGWAKSDAVWINPDGRITNDNVKEIMVDSDITIDTIAKFEKKLCAVLEKKIGDIKLRRTIIEEAKRL